MEERDALSQAVAWATPTNEDELWTCKGAELGNAYVRQRIRLGELGAAREALDRSGETVQESARKHREFIEKIQRDAMQRRRNRRLKADSFHAGRAQRTGRGKITTFETGSQGGKSAF